MDVESKIPHRPPFLFVDKVVSCDDTTIVAERTMQEGDFFYKGHYPDNPITPGVILCEACFQAGAILLVERLAKDPNGKPGATPVLSRIQDARFKRMVRPGDTIRIEVKFKETLSKFHFLSCKISCEGKPVMSVDCALALVDEAAAKG